MQRIHAHSIDLQRRERAVNAALPDIHAIEDLFKRALV